MKYNLLRMLCAALCIIPLQAAAQTCGKSTSPEQLYQEGHALFRQKAYTAACRLMTVLEEALDSLINGTVV